MKMDPESQMEGNGGGVPLLREYRHGSEDYVFESMYDRPLPCCGCGIGWCSFVLGFIFPLFWYYGTCLFFAEHYRHDPRERPGLAACAIAGLVSSVAIAITFIVLWAEWK